MSRRPWLGRWSLGVGLAAVFAVPSANGAERGEVMARARAIALHPWRMETQNLTAECSAAYESDYVPGDYVGLPYDWGGYMTLFQFDQNIDAGQGAGSYPEDGILACTAGLDCSGFVSQAWQIGHYTTSSLHEVSTEIPVGSMLGGDVFNEAGFHVAMLSELLGNGVPVFVEAIGYNVHYNATGGWAHVDGYIPRRGSSVSGTSVAEPIGTPMNPIVVSSLPFTDNRNTVQSGSDLLDGCGASPTKNESGREYVYEVTFSQPGSLTATVSDDAGVDIDIHVYSSTNTSDCFARHDTTVTVGVDCGTYLVVADTFRGASGELPGAYALNLSFVPSGGACGAGPEGYSPEGELGDACGYPGNPALPFCNPNLGADTCLYTDNASFCSKPCAVDSDCDELTGGCCGDIGSGELYCFSADLCGGEPPPEEEEPPPGGDPSDDELGGAPGNGGGSQGGASAAGGAGSGNAPSSGGSTATGSSDDAASDSSDGCAAAPRSGGASGAWALFVAAALGLARRRRG